MLVMRHKPGTPREAQPRPPRDAGLFVVPGVVPVREGMAWLADWQGTRGVLRCRPVPGAGAGGAGAGGPGGAAAEGERTTSTSEATAGRAGALAGFFEEITEASFRLTSKRMPHLHSRRWPLT